MLSPNLKVAMNDEEKSLAKVVLYRYKLAKKTQPPQSQFIDCFFSYAATLCCNTPTWKERWLRYDLVGVRY